MTESKILSIRINADLCEEFKSLCTRNKKSKKTILLECINLLIKAEKSEKSDLKRQKKKVAGIVNTENLIRA